MSAALGADLGGYRIVGLRAGNPRQRLSVQFSAQGVTVVSGGSRLRLAVSGLGRSGRLIAVPAAVPVVHANRVTYGHRRLREWWANGPLGLEQGFVVIDRPAGRVGPLTLSLALRDTSALRLVHGSVFLGGGLRYGGLVASDATGRALPARLDVRSGRITIEVADRNAHYPVRIDPFVQQAELAASDGVAGEALGTSVAVSGGTIVVGAIDHKVANNFDQGAVYVFVEPASGWANATQTAELTASDGQAFDFLGNSVAVSGGTIVAGANAHNGGRGAAYVFSKPASGWANATQTAELTASGGAANDALGWSVAVSGNTIVAGAPSHKVGANANQGAAYVYVEPPSGWANNTQSAQLTASDGAAGDQLGTSVAVSGRAIVAGAPSHKVGAHPKQGAAYVYVEPASGWASNPQSAELTASDGATSDQLGSAVALSGGTLVAGAPLHQVGANAQQGAAYAFTEPASGWLTGPQTSELTASDGAAGDQLGTSVAVSGTTIVAGAPYHNGSQGAAYVFLEPTSAGATQTAELTATDGAASDTFGWSAAASGGTVVVGAYRHNGRGAAYAFVTPPPRVNIISPATGASYVQGEAVSASYSCIASTPATIGSCAGSVADNAPIDTSTPGSHTFAVHATDSFGGTNSRSVTYTVIAAAAPAPVVSAFKQSHRRWREGRGLPRIGAQPRSRSKPVGTIFSFTVNESATVRLVFTVKASGRKLQVKGRSKCVAQTKHNRHKAACRRTIIAGAFSLRAPMGRDQIAFRGRTSARHKLAPGNYTVTITAMGASGKTSKPQSLRFTIL